MRAFMLGDQEIAVTRVAGRIHAFSNVCTHRQDYLTNGFIIEGQVICGSHEATYDLTSGAILYGPAFEPLPVFQVRVEGDDVQVQWPEELSQEDVSAVDTDDEEHQFARQFMM